MTRVCPVFRDKRGAVPAHYAAQVSREALHLVLEKAATKVRISRAFITFHSRMSKILKVELV